MSDRPRVSAVMIFLNAAPFIGAAIESVLAQTFTSWELLLVDDGSSDESSAIAREYARRRPEQVRYLEHPGHQNRGMSASRNLGVRHARGELVALLDADDIWLPRMLERRVAELDATPEAGMVYGPTLWWYSWTGEPGDVGRDFSDRVEQRGIKAGSVARPPDALTLMLRDGGAVPCTCSLLVRRAAWEAAGGFEESFRGLYEDQVFYAKICARERVLISGERLAQYRQHPRSCTASAASSDADPEARRRFLSWLSAYLDRQQIDDPQLRQALRQALWQMRHPRVTGARRTGRLIARRALDLGRRAAGRALPAGVRRRLPGARDAAPPVGAVHLGDLRRLTPISRRFGYDRGQPVDRFYIERFLHQHRADVRGRVLEVGDASYTRAFGGDRVSQSDVLYVDDSNPHATIIADLASCDHVPADSFDCIILTQTFQLIYDLRGAVRSVYRLLKPGGVLLATFPGISQLDHGEWRESWYWSFTTRSVARLFGECFPTPSLQIRAHGNVLAATAFLQGLASGELTPAELGHGDPQYELLISLRAVKPAVAP